MTSRPGSVFSSDTDALTALMKLYAPLSECPRILDCTYSKGTMWRGVPEHRTDILVRSDLAPHPQLDLRCDYLHLPFVSAFDVIVWDPPHIADAGKESVIGKRFGSVKLDWLYFREFAQQAYHALKPRGLLLAKITDGIHGQKYRDHMIQMWGALKGGFDRRYIAVLLSPQNKITDPKWKHVENPRIEHVYWVAATKKKEKPHARRPKRTRGAAS